MVGLLGPVDSSVISASHIQFVSTQHIHLAAWAGFDLRSWVAPISVVHAGVLGGTTCIGGNRHANIMLSCFQLLARCLPLRPSRWSC